MQSRSHRLAMKLPASRLLAALGLVLTSCNAAPRAETDSPAPPICAFEVQGLRAEEAVPAPRDLRASLPGEVRHALPRGQVRHALAPTPGDKPASPRDTATVALSDILDENAAFVREHDPSHFVAFEDHQHPRITMVACADSRFHENALESEPDGDIFVVRNIGNQLDRSEGSVEYGVRHLHTPLLLVVGHVGCGAVKAALGDYGEEPHTIRHELDGLHLSLRDVMNEKGTFEARWQHGVLDNVHRQVANAAKEYDDLVSAGELVVVGGVYDFRDEMKGGRGRLHVISINGQRDLTRPPASDLLEDVRKAAGAHAF